MITRPLCQERKFKRFSSRACCHVIFWFCDWAETGGKVVSTAAIVQLHPKVGKLH